MRLAHAERFKNTANKTSTFAPQPVGLLSILKVNMNPTLFTSHNAWSEMTFQMTSLIPLSFQLLHSNHHFRPNFYDPISSQ